MLFYLLFKTADIYCGIDLDTCIPTLLAAKIKGKQHYYDAHELFPYVPEVINRKLVQKFWLRVEKIVFQYSNKVYTVSSAIANWFEEKYQENGKRDWRPVDTPKEEQGPTPRDQKTSWPTREQRNGIELSLDSISMDIDFYLNKK